jgi:hypothetical protein
MVRSCKPWQRRYTTEAMVLRELDADEEGLLPSPAAGAGHYRGSEGDLAPERCDSFGGEV